MKKSEFIELISKKLEISKSKGEHFYETFISSLVGAIKKEKDFKLVGLGTFKIKRQKARKGVNLQTGAPITIPAKDVLKFKVSKSLKDEIAGK